MKTRLTVLKVARWLATAMVFLIAMGVLIVCYSIDWALGILSIPFVLAIIVGGLTFARRVYRPSE